MVNKSSFLQRLKERWGASGSGVRVERRDGLPAEPAKGAPAGNGHGAASARRVEDEARAVSSSFAPADVRSQRKMSEREEALLALGTHFQELSTMLRGSHARMDDQLTKLVDATSALPALSQQQLDMLRAVSTQMDRQNALGEQLAATMTKLPNLLQSVEGALARAAATDERTAATVREFQSTMDRIHGSMGQMVQHSEQQAKASMQLAERRDESLRGLATGIEESQQRAVHELRRATDEGLQSLRRSTEDQSNRLQQVVQQHAGWNRAVLVGIGFVVLGIGALIVLQLVR